MKAVITDKIEMPEKYLAELKELGVTIYDDLPKTTDEIIERIRDAEVITVNWIDMTAEIIDAAPHLKYIIVPAVGFNAVDFRYAAEKNIKVINCPTFPTISVAEHAMGLLFTLARRILENNDDLRKGIWARRTYTGVQLEGKKLGLIGYGNIGKKLEAMATGIGLKVSYVNSKSTPDEVDTLLCDSDFICLCAPLNDKTHHMIDARRLKLLKKIALLINIGRGGLIDQPALIESLERGDFAGAGLDVFEGEPISHEAPAEIVKIANLPNVVATPHSAWNTPETGERLGQELCANVRACLAGNPANVVN